MLIFYHYQTPLCIDGLGIASRLSKSITSTSKKMRQLLTKYNNGLPLDSQITWETASHLHEQSHRATLTASVSDSIPHDIKYEAVQRLRTVERCQEEFNLLKNEIQNCIDFFDQKIKKLQGLQELIRYVIMDI